MMIAELKNGQDLVLDGNFELLIEPNLELALSMTFRNSLSWVFCYLQLSTLTDTRDMIVGINIFTVGKAIRKKAKSR